MKLLHEYEDELWTFIWAYHEPEFTLDKLQQYKDDFERHPHPHQRVLLVDDDYKVEAWTTVANGSVFTRNRYGYLTSDRRQLLLEASDELHNK